MTQHLAEIARHVDEDAHAILIMDQAGWHTLQGHQTHHQETQSSGAASDG